MAAPWAWAPAALIVPALPAVLAQLLLAPGEFTSSAADVVGVSGGPLLFALTFLVAGPLAEEFGWRGYLQPRLRLRFGPSATSVLIGSVWSVWHLPLFLVPGTGQWQVGLLTWQGLAFVLATIPLSLTMLWLSETLRGGVWAAIVAHFSVNVSMALLPQSSAVAAFVSLAATTAIAGGIRWWMRAAAGRRHPSSPEVASAAS